MQITIDPELSALIPPLGDEELAQLETNIVADGCRDPLVVWRNVLIDGHNRLDICKRHKIKYCTVDVELPDRTAARLWIRRNQLGRRNITLGARCELADGIAADLAEQALANMKAGGSLGGKSKVKGSSKLTTPIVGDSREAACKEAGISTGSLTTYREVKKHADAKTLHDLQTKPEVKLHRVAKDIKEKRQRDARQSKRTEAAKSVPALDSRIIVGDFREHADKVADGSVSLIFTDPPYDREASKMLPALADFAEAKLCDGGSLIFYVGHLQLPAAFDAFAGKLRHWWTCACIHEGGHAIMREYGIRVGWKPMLWFVKGTRDDKNNIVIDVMSGGEEKTHHDWQQSESEAAYWIEKLCPPDGLTVDPFLGGGTTGAACNALKREWIGFEIDADTAKIAAGRVA